MDKNNNMVLIAIVAIVAIVGMIVLFTQNNNNVAYPVSSANSMNEASNTGGMAIAKRGLVADIGAEVRASDMCSDIFGTCGPNEPHCNDTLTMNCCRDGNLISANCPTISLT